MSRLSFALLIVTGLMLTAYFGAAAWRMSDDSHMDVGEVELGDAAAHSPPFRLWDLSLLWRLDILRAAAFS